MGIGPSSDSSTSRLVEYCLHRDALWSGEPAELPVDLDECLLRLRALARVDERLCFLQRCREAAIDLGAAARELLRLRHLVHEERLECPRQRLGARDLVGGTRG